MIKEALKNLLDDKKLDTTTIKEVFDEIFSGLSDDVETSAFVTALKLKDLSADEITSAIISANDSFKNEIESELGQKSINSITFREDDNYLDLSLAADLIMMANNLNVFKHSFLPPLKEDKSFKTLNQLGIKPQFKKEEIETSSFSYFHFDYETTFLKYTKNVYRKIDSNNILFLIFNFLNPYRAKNAVLRAKDKENINKLATICLNLNYTNSIVFANDDKLPFVSMEGNTAIAEAWKNKIFTYNLSPDLLEIKPKENKGLIIENIEHSAEIILDVFNNKEKNIYYDAIALNAALPLYISKKADSIYDGLMLAKKTIDDGLAKEKLEQLKRIYS